MGQGEALLKWKKGFFKERLYLNKGFSKFWKLAKIVKFGKKIVKFEKPLFK